jgi:ribonuclease-3
VLADATEALIGALYYDGGLEAARRFVRRAWAAHVEEAGAPPTDAKTALQEWLLARGRPLPAYRELSRDGPDHAPRFTVGVQAGAAEASATGASKREAERLAAEALLRMLA